MSFRKGLKKIFFQFFAKKYFKFEVKYFLKNVKLKFITIRFNFGACVFNEKIYVFGGQRYNESEQSYYTREALDSVEIFDFKTRKWSMGVKMPNPLYSIGVCLYDDDFKCIYVCGTTECSYSGTTLAGFMFTSVFRLEVDSNGEKMKWTIIDKDVSEIKTNYRCVAARINTRKLHKCDFNKN